MNRGYLGMIWLLPSTGETRYREASDIREIRKPHRNEPGSIESTASVIVFRDGETIFSGEPMECVAERYNELLGIIV